MLLLWVGMVVSATILVSSLGFALGTLLPRLSTLIKVVILVAWIGIAQALLNDPELLIVDEPTAGLDPAERVRFRTLLASLTGNRIVLLSTHIISDVEAVANRLLILQEGRVLSDTTPEALLANTAGSVWSVTTDQATALQESPKLNFIVSQSFCGISGRGPLSYAWSSSRSAATQIFTPSACVR